jgi:uncharacterized protein YndB with AHSA1/START domain
MTAKSERTSPGADAMEREVVITRVFDAPRELVFKAWTEPERLMRWFGPHGFTVPRCEVDLRLGGAWHIVMRGPNGDEHPCGGAYREIAEPERLVFTNRAMDAEGNLLLDGLTTVLLEEHAGKTKLTLRTSAKGLVPYAAQMLSGMEIGWTQSLERLEQLVATSDREIVTTAGRVSHEGIKEKNVIAKQSALTVTLPSDCEILMTRVFNAPRELVFAALSKLEHVKRWWGPRNTALSVCEMDFRPGGAWRYVMQLPNGASAVFKGVYREIEPPERMVATECFDDPSVGSPEWITTVTLEEHNGQTTLTSRVLHKSVESRNGHLQSGMEPGASETFDRLAELLESLEK